MHMHLPHGYERFNERAQPLRELFWVLALGVLLVFAFFVVLGAIKPGAVIGLTAGVCVLAGTAFGGIGTGHVRISYANSRETLAGALDRIRGFVEGLPAGTVAAASAR